MDQKLVTIELRTETGTVDDVLDGQGFSIASRGELLVKRGIVIQTMMPL